MSDIQDVNRWILQNCVRCRSLLVVPQHDCCSYMCRSCAAQESLTYWCDVDLLYGSDSDADDWE